jgi:hypothetical protein
MHLRHTRGVPERAIKSVANSVTNPKAITHLALQFVLNEDFLLDGRQRDNKSKTRFPFVNRSWEFI